MSFYIGQIPALGAGVGGIGSTGNKWVNIGQNVLSGASSLISAISQAKNNKAQRDSQAANDQLNRDYAQFQLDLAKQSSADGSVTPAGQSNNTLLIAGAVGLLIILFITKK